MIGIIDYGLGNIKAFDNIYKRLNISFKRVQIKTDLIDVDRIILPGVGAFDTAIENLQRSGLKEVLDELVLEKKIPILGICVGMQILAKSSDEGNLPGLSWIDAVVKMFDRSKLSNNMPLPHMGWNGIEIKKKNPLLKNIDSDSRFYFLHSYYFYCNDQNDIVATANYGEEFTCIINHDNIYGVQCHPEKSHQKGIQLLKNFGEL